MTTYGLGYLGKWEWIEKWLKKSKEDILKFQIKVQKIGLLAAAFTWLPLVGDLAALALGFLKFKPIPVAVMMFLGRFIRFVVSGYIAAYILERVGG
jgi:membrane protein YqaA with SNARE-associated domain